jgi:N6-adenosine-specific RNA methylase IME4
VKDLYLEIIKILVQRNDILVNQEFEQMVEQQMKLKMVIISYHFLVYQVLVEVLVEVLQDLVCVMFNINLE